LNALDQQKERRYLCHRGRVAELLEVVMEADNFGHIVNLFIQNLVKAKAY
jgi:hypothetical protein